ncbi:MAG TPA: carboxypeptidase regulatory-like domain-containing protein, partial [Polyangiaceae bacterium]|nr:carboxypeptidase regulatory-like domain-containing protein [Polyangiaceae bacterium]
RFVLQNVPVGSDIPLVVQVGEWRREFNIGTVEACVDTPVADQTLRLPSRQSEGDIPKIAVATGALDALECLVRKLGIAPEEFTNPSSSGRVNLFAGFGGADHFVASMNGGESFPPSVALWADLPSLQPYDIVLLSCDGRRPDKTGADDKNAGSLQAMFDYLNLGGRVFASHYQEVWFQKGPAPFPDLAQYAAMPRELGSLSAQVVTSFPKGQAMSDWALANGASTTPGQVDIRGAEYTIAQENPAYAQRWLADDNPPAVQYLSANTPLGAAEADQCGRVVLSDLHVSPGLLNEGDDVSTTKLGFPDGCVSKGFSPQEKLLAFMLFDISACVVPDSQAPSAPQIR